MAAVLFGQSKTITNQSCKKKKACWKEPLFLQVQLREVCLMLSFLYYFYY